MQGKKNLGAVIIVLVWLVFGLLVLAEGAVPRLINYQGRVTDHSGAPLNGSYQITFKIYDAENGGTLLWQETHAGALVQKGLVSLLLGSVNNLNLAFDQPYYLEIKVEDEVLSPRQYLSAAGYAIRAATAEYASKAGEVDSLPAGCIIMWGGTIASIPSGWKLCDGTNGTPDLRDRFVVGASQDNGGVAKTNVSGALTQTGGEAKHTLTIEEIPAHTHSYRWYPSWRFSGDSEWGAKGSPDDSHQTGSAGGGQAHNNLPPYYALAYIMKTQ